MKKLIIIAIVAVLLAGCLPKSNSVPGKIIRVEKAEERNDKITITITIDLDRNKKK